MRLRHDERSRAEPAGGRVRQSFPGWLELLLAAAWLVVVGGPPLALLGFREQRLAEISAPESQADWDAFRADMRGQAHGSGPVQRKVPRSAEPPERVWLRDHVPLAITAWITLVGVLGAVLAALVIGVARGPQRPRHEAAAATAETPRRSPPEDGPRGSGHDEEHHDGYGQHAQERRHD